MSPELVPERPAPPRPSLLHTLRMIASGGGGRADMLTRLRPAYEQSARS